MNTDEKTRAPFVLGDFLPAKFRHNILHSRLEDVAPYLRDALSVLATPPESAQQAYPAGSDREVLLYLMQQFDSESWECPKCGHSDDCATMDSAHYLRSYLATSPEPPAATECCRTVPCKHPGIGPCDMPAKPAAQEGVKGALRLLEGRIDWLKRWSDDGQHRKLHGPSAGDVFDLSMELEDIAALICRLAQPVAEVDEAAVERACASMHGRNWPLLFGPLKAEIRDEMRAALTAALRTGGGEVGA